MVNSRQKGHKAELLVANMLTRWTNLPFEQTPGSGSGKIKGDLWLKHHINHYLIEVKFYKDDAISTKVFTNKSNNFVQWWVKTCQQADDNNLEPLLFFKANHAQFFISTKQKPQNIDYMYISFLDSYVCLAEKWLEKEKQEWTHGDRIYEPWKAANT
jgi:hypothetical protein